MQLRQGRKLLRLPAAAKEHGATGYYYFSFFYSSQEDRKTAFRV
jgi:hypothetical protein